MDSRDYSESILKALTWADAQEVAGMSQFLTENAGITLVSIGSGGSLSVANYAALLYGTRCAIGRSVTPLTANSLSDEALRACKVLLVSASGHNKDINYLADRLATMGHNNTANLSIKDGASNKLRQKIQPALSFNYTSEFSSDFIEFESVVAKYALLCKAFGNSFTPQVSRHLYDYGCREGSVPVVPLSNIRNLVVLYADYSEPVAIDMESKMVEAGLASVQLSDYRNFCHGRFAFVANHIGGESDHMERCDTAMVILSSQNTKTIAERLLTILPAWCPVVTISTEQQGMASSIDLLIKSSLFYIDFANAKGMRDPLNPKCTYIDKRAPQNKVTFISDLKKQGPLSSK